MTINIISELFFINEKIDYKSIADIGFEGIEFRVQNIIDREDLKEIEIIKSELEKNKLKVFSIHAPFKNVDLSSTDEYLRKKSIREIEKSILIAEKLKAQYVVLHLSSYFDNNRDIRFQNAIKSLKEIKTISEMFGIEIIVENVLPNMIMYNFEETENIIKLGYHICFDIGHAFISNINIKDYYKTFEKHIKIIHLNSNNAVDDEHYFIDKYNYKEIKNVIKLFDENKIVVFEILKRDYTLSQLMNIYKEVYK